MWPEVDETPPRDADVVLPEVLRRGRELRRQQTRRRQAGLLARAAGTMAVVGLVAAVARGTDEPTVRTQVAAPPTTADGGAPGSSSTFPPFTVGGSSGTAPGAPGSSTTVGATAGRTAPIVVLEVRDRAGRYQTAVLEPGALAPVAITSATGERQTPVISPDGRSIAYQQLQPHPLTGQPRWELFVIDPDGTDRKQVTGALLGDTGTGLLDPSLGAGTRWPSWSPDGSRLAFGCSGPTGLPQICVSDASGRGRLAITPEGQGFYQPAWSPDGSTIAARREVSPGHFDVWLLDPAAQAAPVHLPTPTLDADGATLTWLPDGTLVYPLSDDPGGAMGALDVATGRTRTIPAPGPVRFPIACGRDQVLYLQTAVPVEGPQLLTGALVLTGTDGSGTTVLLPADEGQERLPASCALR